MLTPTTIEPQKARFTKSHALIKDHYYYHGKEFCWNRPATVTDKYYPYFHKQKDENKAKIEQLQNQEKEDMAVVEQMRREHLIEKKQETQTRYYQRVKERNMIQTKSQQPMKSCVRLDSTDCEEMTLDLITKRNEASKHLRSNEISWNHLHKASKKYVDQVLRPVSVQREHEMLEYFRKKLKEEQKGEEDKQERYAEHHKAIRKIFLNKHEENFDKEKKLGLTPAANSYTSLQASSVNVPLPSIHTLEPDNSRRESAKFALAPSGPSLLTTDGEFKLKYTSSLPNVDAMRTAKTPSLEQLSRPRKQSKREYNLEYSELKGMLVKNMDDKVYHSGNNFYDAIASQSKFFQETLKENRDNRKKKSTFSISTNDRPETGSRSGLESEASNRGPSSLTNTDKQSGFKIIVTKKAPVLNERDEIYNEIDQFEKKMPLTRMSGYGRAEMKETLRNLTIKPENQ